MRKALLPIVAVLAVTGWLALAMPVNASAATSACTRSKPNCALDGQSPVTTGCAKGAYPVSNAPVFIGRQGQVGYLHLMYSPSCNTNWAEADGYFDPVDIVAWNAASPEQWYASYGLAGSYGYTAMVNGAFDAGACLRDDAYGIELCMAQSAAPHHQPSGW
jgi:Protein of unknown function (DUF2690)